MIYVGGKVKMANVLDELLERGYIKQFTHEDETRELLEKESKNGIY